MTTEQPLTTILLTSDDALMFEEFLKHHDVIGYFVGYLKSMGTNRIENSQVILDIDSSGTITHTSITKHFRKII